MKRSNIRLYKVIIFFNLIALSNQLEAFQIIDTLGTYSDLKFYTGLSDTVYINHERYFGSFARDSCTLEDHGTTIMTISGCWRRIHNNFSPRFWALGGQSNDNQIGIVHKEIDAINSAAIAAYNTGGDTIEIDSMYLIDRSVFLLTNNTYLGTSDSCGFIRADPPITILTDTAKINDNKIFVENNDGFRTFQEINIVNGQAFDSIAGHISYKASVSTVLGGDSIIWLSGRKIQKEMLPGDSVSLFFSMMRPRFNDLDSIYIKNLIFDGNHEKYNLNYDWRVNKTISIPTTNQAIIEQCKFYRIPNENVFLCGAVFRNCSGIDLNGSINHFSCNSFDHPTEVLYNHFSTTNIIGDELMKHSEAGFTFSAKVQNLRLAYNHINGIGEYGVGIFQNDDSSNEITDNLLDSELESIEFQAFYIYPETNVIYNNKNLNFADTSTLECWMNTPNLTNHYSCQGMSSFEQPLNIGDTIKITIDSLLLRKSNENFIKEIIPIYDEDFFTLVKIEVNTPEISQFHEWVYIDTLASNKSLIFDNGHRDGIYSEGNWGYEGCSQNGKCTNLSFYFSVNNLPDSTSMVDCPFQGFEVKYDGQLGNWNHPIYCQNQPIYFDTLILGSPVIQGKTITSLYYNNRMSNLEIYPNPSEEYINFSLPFKSDFKYQIYNTIGYKIEDGVVNDENILINHLPSGLYLLRIHSDDQSYFGFFSKM